MLKEWVSNGAAVLGIDGSLTTGWCLAVAGRRMPLGWGILRLDAPEGVARASRRMDIARHAFRDILARTMPDLVAREDVPYHRSFKSTAATLSHVTVYLALEYECAAAGVRLVSLMPAEVKKHATGSGVADKPKMLAAALKRWGVDLLGQDDVADAMWVADLAASRVGRT